MLLKISEEWHGVGGMVFGREVKKCFEVINLYGMYITFKMYSEKLLNIYTLIFTLIFTINSMKIIAFLSLMLVKTYLF
jgi:hypothetical protein